MADHLRSEEVSASLEGTGGDQLLIVAYEVKEALSALTEIRIIAQKTKGTINLKDVVGKTYTLKTKRGEDPEREFKGICVAAEQKDPTDDAEIYIFDLRPSLWKLTRTKNTRIFQQKTTADIIKDVCSGLSYSSVESAGTGQTREYCVQYDESDFAFISRLQEEDGMFFRFDHSATPEKLVIGTDSVGGDGASVSLEFTSRNAEFRTETFYGWNSSRQVLATKVSLFDYNFTTANSSLGVTKSGSIDGKSFSDFEVYGAGGRYNSAADGEKLAEGYAKAEASRGRLTNGSTMSMKVKTGGIVSLQGLPTSSEDGTYFVVSARHVFRRPLADMRREMTIERKGGSQLADTMVGVLNEAGLDLHAQLGFETHFECIPSATPHKPARVTPWPAIEGVQTAVVTGPSGEEIYTDQYGRIKVQFHWDRDGQKNESTTCWVRTVMPWAGKNFGMVAIPRIGQEVIIQFERGNPDRPICTGMVYNSANMPPYGLPDNMTQSGIKTESSKGGGGFNELVFEDKKDAEFVRMQSEKDYTQIIKNNATITIGLEKADAGDLTQTIQNHKTETLKEGNHTFTVEKGTETLKIQGDQSLTIVEGNQTLDVQQGNQTVTIAQGNQSLTVSQGKREIKVDTGNQETTVAKGDVKIDATAGSITISAAQKIELKVGGSTITIEPTSITLASMSIKAEADMAFEASGGLSAKVSSDLSAELSASGAVTVSGKPVNIN